MQQKKSIGQLLVQFGKITEEDLTEGLRCQKEMGLRLGETLIRMGRVTRDDIDWILSKQFDIPFIVVENVVPDAELLNKFSRDFLMKNRILPLYENSEVIAIAIEDPLNQNAVGEMERIAGKKVFIASGSGEKIIEIIDSFFHKGTFSDLRSAIDALIVKLEGTSFYRIDFMLREDFCSVSVFGCGIMKHMLTLKSSFTKENVYSVFTSLGTSFLLEEYENNFGSFISVYPLTHRGRLPEAPAVYGLFGLCLPDGTSFADVPSRGVQGMFCSDQPVIGYPYLAIRSAVLPCNEVIFTLDRAPLESARLYVRAAVPQRCNECAGQGCSICNEMGYSFERQIDGYYSGAEIINIFPGEVKWPR